MARATEDTLRPLLPLLRQLREIRGLNERQPGIFYRGGSAFLHFHDDAGLPCADLKRAGGSGFDRYPLATPQDQRRLVDDARRRVAREDDD